MVKLIKEVPQCKHHKKKKLKPNEFWSPNPFEMYKKIDDPDKKKEIKLIPEMLNLLGCSKDNFKKLIQKMNYKAYEKDNEIYFQYSPIKEKKKNFIEKTNIKNNPFKVLKNINFS